MTKRFALHSTKVFGQTIAGVFVASLLAAQMASAAARTDLVLGIALEPPHLDPTAGAAAAIDEVTYANLFEGLTRIDETGAVIPGLAESWDVAADGLTYTFKLRTGVKFHDGADFTADDVKFSIDRAMAADSTNAQKALFDGITAVNVVDPATVTITLSRPVGSLLYNFGWGDAVIVDPASAATNKENPIAPDRSSLVHGQRARQSLLLKTMPIGATRRCSTKPSSALSPTPLLRPPRCCPATCRCSRIFRRRKPCRNFRLIRVSPCQSARPRAKPSFQPITKSRHLII
jgi:ABC-type transport system substrate-binding protein